MSLIMSLSDVGLRESEMVPGTYESEARISYSNQLNITGAYIALVREILKNILQAPEQGEKIALTEKDTVYWLLVQQAGVLLATLCVS